MGAAEAHVEEYLRKRVKQLGGQHRKVVYQGRDGSPDDWCFFPGGRLIIVECKAPGEKPSKRQMAEIEWLRMLGFDANWTDSREGVDMILSKVKP